MALLKFFEGKESSYSSSSHSGGLYFAKDTGVILFKGVKYGSKPDLSNYATKSDISSLQSKLNEKADADHTHSKSDITDLGLASSSQDGLMSTSDKSLFDKYQSMWSDQYGTGLPNGIPVVGVMPDQYKGDLRLGLIRNEYKSLRYTTELVVIPNATTSNAGAMSAEDKKNLDNLVGDKSIIKKVYFNKTPPLTPPNNTLSDVIEVENNKVGFLFSSPLSAMFENYDDPTGDPGYVKTIKVTMPEATTARNGYMTKQQVNQLNYLYETYNGKIYLSLSGGTVTGYTTFKSGLESGNGFIVREQGIELYSSDYPFIDFHYEKSSADYTSRIIEASSGVLNINEVSLSNGQVTATKVTQTSDIRLKENISTIVEDTDKIKNVKFFEFNHISDKNKTKSYGVIAQDLEEVGLKDLVIEDADGYKSVDYISLLVLEIQRLRNEVNTLKSKIR